MSTVILNYGIGNLMSIANMLRKAGEEASISSMAADIAKAERLILPGIGHFGSCVKAFNTSGLRDLVEERVLKNGIPILGICVGAQMMTIKSEESTEAGLGWINAETVRFKPGNSPLKIPHMGWSEIQPSNNIALFSNLPNPPRFYFAHSYHFRIDESSLVIAHTNYIYDFAAAFQIGNIYGVQFHPEKSHQFGLALMKNFIQISAT